MKKQSIETLIRRLAEETHEGYHHIALSIDTRNGKSCASIFRDTIGAAPYRYVENADPVDALSNALNSIIALKKPAKKTPDDDII